MINKIRIKFIAILVVGWCFMWLPKSNWASAQQSVQSGWRTYTNTKFGFSFIYPSSWSQQDNDREIIDATGVVTTLNITFANPSSKTTILIAYTLAPNGLKAYQDIASQFNSAQGHYAKDARLIEVAGRKAFEGSITIDKDGRGNILTSPFKIMVINFLDKKGTGKIELQFKTPLTNENLEGDRFKQLLSSFTFIKN
jgi:hypothetical protein